MAIKKKFFKHFVVISICIFSLFILSIDIFADSSSLVVDDVPGASNVINQYKADYPFYYLYKKSDGSYQIRLFTRQPSHFESATGSQTSDYGCGFFIFSDSASDYFYRNCKLKSNGSASDWTIGSSISCSSSQKHGLSCNADDIISISHDVTDSVGNVVFMPTPHKFRQIVGGITSETIRETVLTQILYLMVLVVSCLVLVMAFRKAWALLVTSSRGA